MRTRFDESAYNNSVNNEQGQDHMVAIENMYLCNCMLLFYKHYYWSRGKRLVILGGGFVEPRRKQKNH